MKSRRWMVCLFAAALAFAGCADDEDDGGHGVPGDEDAATLDDTSGGGDAGTEDGMGGGDDSGGGGDMATIEGRADSLSEKAVEGAVVTAHKVEADGSLTMVSQGEVMTAADGSYQLQVDATASADTDLIVRAESDSMTGDCILSQDVESGMTVTAAPINIESNAEAKAYVSARAEGSWCSTCTTEGLRAQIDSETAAALEASSSFGADVAATAEASSTAMAAWSAGAMSEASGATQAEVDAALEAQADAQAQLSSDLDAATSEGEMQAAMDAYAEAVVQGYADAGLDATQRATAQQCATEGILAASSDISADVQAKLTAKSEMQRAMHVTAAVESRFEAASGSSSEAVVSARETLMTDIEAAAEAGASARTDIEAAWQDYESTVQGELRSGLDVAAQATFDTVVGVVADAGTTFESDVQAAASSDMAAEARGQAIADAVSSFRTSLDGEAALGALTDLGVAEGEATAMIDVLFLAGCPAATD